MSECRHDSYGWERGNSWQKFSVTILNEKLQHFQSPLRSIVWVYYLTTSGLFLRTSPLLYDAVSIIWRSFIQSLTMKVIKTVVHTFIARQTDYCNSIFYQISAANLQALQSVLKAGVWLVTRKQKFDHIMATLCDDLHWLPNRQPIAYKICTIVYKWVHKLHHPIWQKCALRLPPALVAVISVQQHMAICWCLEWER